MAGPFIRGGHAASFAPRIPLEHFWIFDCPRVAAFAVPCPIVLMARSGANAPWLGARAPRALAGWRRCWWVTTGGRDVILVDGRPGRYIPPSFVSGLRSDEGGDR